MGLLGDLVRRNTTEATLPEDLARELGTVLGVREEALSERDINSLVELITSISSYYEIKNKNILESFQPLLQKFRDLREKGKENDHGYTEILFAFLKITLTLIADGKLLFKEAVQVLEDMQTYSKDDIVDFVRVALNMQREGRIGELLGIMGISISDDLADESEELEDENPS